MGEINWETFDVPVPWESVPRTDTVEEGRYVLRVREIKLQGSRGSEKLPPNTMIAVGFFTIEEPVALQGVSFPISNYTLGTADDPQCSLDPNTWKRTLGGRQLVQLLDACNVAYDERSLRLTLQRAVQCRFQAYVTRTIQKEGEYAGQEQNRITKYAPFGQELRMPGRAAGVPSGLASGQASVQNGPPVPRSRMRPEMAQQTLTQDDVGPVPSELIQ